MDRHACDMDLLPRDLGDGLLLRRATAADTEALVELNVEVFEEPADGEGAHTVRALLRSDHPTMGDGGFTLVEDLRTGAVVSSLCLIPQTWTYGGIPFAVGRPELVVPRRDHRRRGLVRAQFAVIH